MYFLILSRMNSFVALYYP